MMEAPSSCSSSRAEAFPAGLRVLVVDDDPTWLKILEKMLRKCSYEVTTCGLARAALEMLRTKRGVFDIVISDVNMPDMDGFKLLEHVGLEMDLPVIMMSVDGETSRVMKGVQHGACDYLLKPVRMKELRNIWQHVFRKKIHEIKEVESHDNSSEEIQFLSNEFAERQQMLYAGDLNSTLKRKDMTENTDIFVDTDVFDHASSVKKARVIWTVDLHQKFVDAVNQIGFDKVGPKKILDLMNVPGITRENVASHLQKYRLYLSRLQKQNYGVTIRGGTTAATQTDTGGLKDTTNFVLQIQKAVSHSSGKRRNHVDTVTKTEVSGDAALKHAAISQLQKDSSIKVFGSTSTKTVIPNSQYQIQMQQQQQHDNHCWNLEGIAAIPFTNYSKHYSNSNQSDYHQHRQQMSTESKQKHNVSDIKSNHSFSKQTNLISVQVDHGLLGSKNYGIGLSDEFDQQQNYLFDNLDHPQLQKTVPSSSQYEYLNNIDVNSMDIHNYNNSTQITQLQGDMQFDYEYVFELMKYPSDGAGLYT